MYSVIKSPGLGDIISKYGKLFLNEYPQPLEKHKVLSAIKRCRTDEMGKRLEECLACGQQREVSCSCRNRNCPLCGQYTKSKWLHKKQQELLPVRYFHKVFTLPHELNTLILYNQKVLYNLLFQSVSQTLLTFGKDLKNQFHGGELGFLCFLHTWDQKLKDHFHLHVIIPGGVLSEDGQEWIGVGKSRYLFNRRNLTKVFRAKFLESLEKLFLSEQLNLSKNQKHLKEEIFYRPFLRSLTKCDWVSHSRATIQKSESLLEYLSQYTHRVAITNERILSLSEDGYVTFRYKNRREGKDDTETISVFEFLRRFVIHILPKGFMKVRAYGWMANRYRKDKLSIIRESLRVEKKLKPEPFEAWYKKRVGYNPFLCPYCHKGTMEVVFVNYGNPKYCNTS